MKHHKRSFTLVEILVTTAIICLLSAVILIAYNGIYRSWATSNTVATMKAAHLALDRYALENNQYPIANNGTLGSVASGSNGSAKLVRDILQECAPFSHKYVNGSNVYVAVFDDFGTKPSADDATPAATVGMQEIYYKYPYNNINTFVLMSMGKNGEWGGDDDIIYLPFGLQDRDLKPGFYYCSTNENGVISGELEPIAH